MWPVGYEPTVFPDIHLAAWRECPVDRRKKRLSALSLDRLRAIFLDGKKGESL
jgi:hypothetical protein